MYFVSLTNRIYTRSSVQSVNLLASVTATLPMDLRHQRPAAVSAGVTKSPQVSGKLGVRFDYLWAQGLCCWFFFSFWDKLRTSKMLPEYNWLNFITSFLFTNKARKTLMNIKRILHIKLTFKQLGKLKKSKYKKYQFFFCSFCCRYRLVGIFNMLCILVSHKADD